MVARKNLSIHMYFLINGWIIGPALGKRFRAVVREKLGLITGHPELYACPGYG